MKTRRKFFFNFFLNFFPLKWDKEKIIGGKKSPVSRWSPFFLTRFKKISEFFHKILEISKKMTQNLAKEPKNKERSSRRWGKFFHFKRFKFFVVLRWETSLLRAQLQVWSSIYFFDWLLSSVKIQLFPPITPEPQNPFEYNKNKFLL